MSESKKGIKNSEVKERKKYVDEATSNNYSQSVTKDNTYKRSYFHAVIMFQIIRVNTAEGSSYKFVVPQVGASYSFSSAQTVPNSMHSAINSFFHK